MRVRKRHWVTLVALSTAGAAIFVVLNHTPLVPDHVARLLTDNLLRTGYRVELDAVRTNWRGEVRFVNPRVIAVADSNRVLLRADALQVRMRRPWSVLRGRVLLATMRLERPRVEIDGSTIRQPGAPAPGTALRFPRLVVDAFDIVDGRVTRREGDRLRLLVEDLDASFSVRSRPRELRATVERLSASLSEDSLRVGNLQAGVRIRDDTVHVDDVLLQTTASLVRGSGRYGLADRALRWQGSFAPADLGEARRLTKLDLPPGSLSGAVEATWEGKRFEARGVISGTVEDLTLRDLEFDLRSEPGRFEVRRAVGLVNDGHVDLTLDHDTGNRTLAGTADVRDVDLHRVIPARFAPAALGDVPDHRVSGTCHFMRAGDDTLRVQVALYESRVGEVRVDRATARLALRGSDVRLLNALVEGPLGRLRATGSYQRGVVESNFEADLPRVEPVLELVGRAPEPAGDARITGRISGELATPDVEAELQFGSLSARGAQMWSGAVGIWGRPLGPEPDLDLELRADSLRYRGHTLRSVGADLEYRDGVLHVLRSQGSSGDTLVAAALSIRSSPFDWNLRLGRSTRIDLETALVRIRESEFRVEDPAAIWWRDGAVHVDSLRLATRAGRLDLDGTFDSRNRTLDARARLESVDLESVQQLLALPARLTGSGSGWLQARGSLARTRVDGRIDLRDASFNGLPVDSLSLLLVGSETATDIRELRLATPYGSVQGALWIGETPSLERLLDPARPKPSIGALSRAPISAVLQIESLQLGRFWQARHPDLPAPAWGGQMSAFVALGGTLSSPTIEVRGWAEQIGAVSVRVSGARFDLAYANENLTLRQLDIADEGQRLHAQGELPIRIDFLHGFTPLRDRPLQGEIVLPRSSFTILDRFVPLFVAPPPGVPRGEGEGRVQVSGTIDAPQMRGSFAVYGASFMLRDMEELYRNVDATGEFDGKVLRIRELSGATGPEGTVRGEGEVEFAGFEVGKYRFGLQLRNVPVYSVPEMTAVVSGDGFEVRSVQIGDKLVPDMRGTLDVLRGELRMEFAPEAGSGGAPIETDVPEWMADLGLRAEKGNVWIRNSLVDAELAGSIQLVRRQRESQILGQVRVKRGTYSYLVHRFEITRGELDFSRNVGFNPELDIEGRSGRQGERVYVTLSGSAAEPHLAFSSDRIESSSDDIEQQLLNVTGGGSAYTAVADLAEQVVRDLEIASDISIDPTQAKSSESPEAGAQLGYNLTARRPVSKDVFVVYTQGVRSDIEQRVSVEIDMNRWLLMEAAYERRNLSEAGASQSQNAYFLNLKYRHEY